MSFKFTKPMQAKFLDALAKSGSVDRACEAINVSWQLVYRLRTENAPFRAAWVEVISNAFNKHVAKVAMRASAGLEP
ncbi:MAG: hypothetical protein M3Q42_08290 [Pseudomonadota bacterium]|nr:hypothetical protein [Pseudomonadota bacterium]